MPLIFLIKKLNPNPKAFLTLSGSCAHSGHSSVPKNNLVNQTAKMEFKIIIMKTFPLNRLAAHCQLAIKRPELIL